MRRILVLVLCLLAVLSCLPAASAQTVAFSITNYCTINSGGDCRVSLTVELQLDSPDEDLTFPVPLNASEIRVNGDIARTFSDSNATHIRLGRYTGDSAGSYRLQIEYSLSDVVVNDKGNLILNLTLLSGFSKPVENLQFTVAFPEDIEQLGLKPNFTSTSHNDSMGSALSFSIKGDKISGRTTETLMDHNSVYMTLDVPEDMFPSISTYYREGNPELVPMGICAALALLYWLLFLRTAPVLAPQYKSAPDGLTAGELGCRLTLTGADLGMMVFSWAQLGYITIQMDDRGRVYLHKRMDMGNERDLFEIRTFQTLFGKQQVVEATGYSFARYSRKIRAVVPGERSVCLKSSGNVKIFRLLSCSVQVFCGICFAMTVSEYSVVQTILSILFSVIGVFVAWKIQAAFFYLHLYPRRPKVAAVVAAAVWFIIGNICHQPVIALCAALVQALAGFAAAYGGRRSSVGRSDLAQILGMRKFLKKMSSEDLNKLYRHDPDYFFNMAPYALALGVGTPFAARFGRRPMPVCPYIITGIRGRLTAQDWMVIMKEINRAMQLLVRRLDMEKWAVVRFR